MDSSTFDSIRSMQWNASGRDFLRLRPLIVAPGLALTLILLWTSEAPRAQCIAVTVGMSTLLAFFVTERVRLRARFVDPLQFQRSLAITLAGIVAGCIATGGARSPLLALLFAPTVTAFAAFGRTLRSAAFLAATGLACCVMLLIPQGIPFHLVPSDIHAPIAMGAVVTSLVLLVVSVTGVTNALQASGDALWKMHREALEHVSTRTRLLEQVTGVVSHEIKNPLAAIKGLAQLLAANPESTRTPQRVEVLLAEVLRMESVVLSSLSVSRPISARNAVHVQRWLDEILRAMRERTDSIRVSLDVRPEGLHAAFDPRAMQQVVSNLVLNAIEAGDAKGPVEVVAVREGRHLQMEVRDHGAGMSSETLSRLGTPYFSTKASGHGLGVLVARSLVEQHNGTLEYQSREGEGTVAIVTLMDVCEELLP